LTKDSGLGIALVLVEVAAVLLVRSLGFSREARTLSKAAQAELREKLSQEPGDAASPGHE